MKRLWATMLVFCLLCGGAPAESDVLGSWYGHIMDRHIATLVLFADGHCVLDLFAEDGIYENEMQWERTETGILVGGQSEFVLTEGRLEPRLETEEGTHTVSYERMFPEMTVSAPEDARTDATAVDFVGRWQNVYYTIEDEEGVLPLEFTIEENEFIMWIDGEESVHGVCTVENGRLYADFADPELPCWMWLLPDGTLSISMPADGIEMWCVMRKAS